MRNNLPNGFVYLGDEVADIIQDIRYYSTFNIVGARLDGYEAPIAICTLEVAKALKKISEELSNSDYIIKVFDAYRPQMAVDHVVRWIKDVNDIKMQAYFYPCVKKETIISDGYVMPKSGHSRGGAIDLTLVDKKTGQELDMGTPFDFLDERSHHGSGKITKEQEANRNILKDIMLKYGFAAYEQEWWHYLLKDEPYPDTYFEFKIK